MPTDEQRAREQFEEWVIQDMARFAAPDSSPAELRANVGRRFERDKKTGLYIDECIRDRYLGWLARDAEVQALRSLVDRLANTSDSMEPTLVLRAAAVQLLVELGRKEGKQWQMAK